MIKVFTHVLKKKEPVIAARPFVAYCRGGGGTISSQRLCFYQSIVFRKLLKGGGGSLVQWFLSSSCPRKKKKTEKRKGFKKVGFFVLFFKVLNPVVRTVLWISHETHRGQSGGHMNSSMCCVSARQQRGSSHEVRRMTYEEKAFSFKGIEEKLSTDCPRRFYKQAARLQKGPSANRTTSTTETKKFLREKNIFWTLNTDFRFCF